MARALGLVFSVCLLTATVAGCGTSSPPPTPQEDCYSFVENFLCPTLQICGATYASVTACDDFFENSSNNVLYCATVTSEDGALLDACEHDVNGSYCSELVNSAGFAELPPSCNGVFN